MSPSGSFDQTVERLLARLDVGTPRALIGLAGVPGSGKTTLAVRLTAAVNALRGDGTMAAVGMDGFHLPRAALQNMPDPEAAFARRGAPWTFDAAALAARQHCLKEAAGERPVSWPDFQHDVGDPVEDAHTIPPETRLVLVEGLYLLRRAEGWEDVSQVFDERWYLDTPLEVAMDRLARRHMAAWGLTRDAAERRIASNDRLNAEIVLKTRAFSDWRITG